MLPIHTPGMSTLVENRSDAELVKVAFERIASDLAMIIDRALSVMSITCVRAREKAVAISGIHLSFRIDFTLDGNGHQGCVLVPLSDAIAIAGYLMVMPDEVVKARRASNELDRFAKDAMLEISNFVGGSTDAVLRGWLPDRDVSARSVGCQGVAAGSKPNFRFTNGAELIVGRVSMSLHDYPSFEALVMLPAVLNG